MKFWPPDPFHIKKPSPVLSLHRGRFFAAPAGPCQSRQAVSAIRKVPPIAAEGSLPLPFPLFVQRDLRRTHSACQQQPHPKGPSGCRHRSVVESIITQYMGGSSSRTRSPPPQKRERQRLSLSSPAPCRPQEADTLFSLSYMPLMPASSCAAAAAGQRSWR